MTMKTEMEGTRGTRVSLFHPALIGLVLAAVLIRIAITLVLPRVIKFDEVRSSDAWLQPGEREWIHDHANVSGNASPATIPNHHRHLLFARQETSSKRAI